MAGGKVIRSAFRYASASGRDSPFGILRLGFFGIFALRDSSASDRSSSLSAVTSACFEIRAGFRRGCPTPLSFQCSGTGFFFGPFSRCSNNNSTTFSAWWRLNNKANAVQGTSSCSLHPLAAQLISKPMDHFIGKQQSPPFGMKCCHFCWIIVIIRRCL